VRIHATVLFFALMAAFCAVVVVSVVRLAKSGYSLESYQSDGSSAHRAPRVCMQIEPDSDTRVTFASRQITDQNRVRSSVPIDIVPEQVRLGDGQYTNVTCISDSHNLTIQVYVALLPSGHSTDCVLVVVCMRKTLSS
jgi:hypothetical protein